ncbi:MAG: hypothetical protein HY22_09860 [[Candidatus Thermochlorobacteriaceae] bacterium GBChlB]|nr:MAG: hypothetical protein HY22_09860 [[Candidatus Thermochlorobacteriaceae] bacterium GBChlB]
MDTQILFPHTAIYVADLNASLAFYKAFFGVEPKKLKPGYAKFELHNPRWNFTLNEVASLNAAGTSALSHLGFQVASTDDVKALQTRLKDAGIVPTLEEIGTTCCYAVQDKFWVRSPEGIDWEVFTVLADANVFKDDGPNGNGVCCAPSIDSHLVQLSMPVIQS